MILGSTVVQRTHHLAHRGQYFLRLVYKVDHVGGVLAGIRAVEPGQRLYGVDAAELLVHVHRVQQRLVEAGLELVRDEKDPVVVRVERLPDDAALEVRDH